MDQQHYGNYISQIVMVPSTSKQKPTKKTLTRPLCGQESQKERKKAASNKRPYAKQKVLRSIRIPAELLRQLENDPSATHGWSTKLIEIAENYYTNHSLE